MKTADEIYREMCSNYAELTGVTVRDGCDMAVRLYAAAVQLESLYVYNDWVKSQCFPQTANSEYLDLHAEMRGIKRIEAIKSEGVIKFSTVTPAAYTLTVPVGTICLTASGLRFETLQEGEILTGGLSCECLARCIDAGLHGNVAASTIVYMQQPPVGISSCVNEAPFTGGVDNEDDDSLRKRILNTYSSLPTGANAAYYEKLALSVTGVSAARVIPKNRGVGTVDIIISAHSGIPADTLVEQVIQRMNTAREICVDIRVSAPSAVNVNIEIGIETENGYSFDTVSANVRQAIGNYFNGKLLGKNVLKAKLGNIIYGIEGVQNYSIIMPEDDININANELPVLGNVIINPMNQEM